MVKMTTWRKTALAAVIAASAASSWAEVKIGFLATLSGSAAALGQDQYDGFMLALEQMGGQLGNVPVKTKVFPASVSLCGFSSDSI